MYKRQGSLIYLNNNKFHAQTYGINLYGSDRSIPLTERTSTIKQAYLPVFGLKDGDDAFFSIIERGDAMANIDVYKRQATGMPMMAVRGAPAVISASIGPLIGIAGGRNSKLAAKL